MVNHRHDKVYIGTQFWNQGRTQEIRDRVLHVSLEQIDPQKLEDYTKAVEAEES